jgi:hypothetical protein
MSTKVRSASSRASVLHSIHIDCRYILPRLGCIGHCSLSCNPLYHGSGRLLLYAGAVCSCEPAVEAMPQLLVALNGGSLSFSEFVRQMRQSFCDVAATHTA